MKATLEQLADRHFRPDPQGVFDDKDPVLNGHVLVTVAQEQATTSAGQHLAWMLTNLLARQLRVVTSITLNIPEAHLHDSIAPFGNAANLKDTLINCITLVSGEHIRPITDLNEDEQYDIQLVVGGAFDANLAKYTLHVYADGWRWYVGIGESCPSSTPSSTLSFGPHMAACYAAGEVFKRIRGMRPGKGEFIRECFGSVWTMSLSASWEELTDGPTREELPILPHFYFAGAGAVAQAAALTLASSQAKGACTAIDHDMLDVTNDNRYALSNLDHEGNSKATILSSYLSSQGIKCHPAEMKWNAYIAGGGTKAINQDVSALEKQYKYPLVLSCVDKNIPRHEIQNALPHIIIGGSTDGLCAKVQVYYLGYDTACLKCFNPAEDRDAIIQQNLETLSKMTPIEREEWCRRHEITPSDLERMRAPHECGKLNEADLDRFAKGPPEMSVGFVSVAAGILLSAKLIQLLALGADSAVSSGHVVAATFSRPGMRYRNAGRDSNCDCQTTLRQRWNRIWP